MKKTAWLLLISLTLAGCRSSMPDTRRELNLASFDQIWKTVQDKHYDPTLGGLDWNAVRDELRPKVASARTDDEARAVMRQMLARLKLSHFEIYEADKKIEPTPGTGFVPALASTEVIERVQFGNLPELPLRCHSEMLKSNVQYFYVSFFINPPKVLGLFRKAIEQARDADGFILDLRHNPGGIGGMAMGIGNAFITKPNQKLGEMIQREMTFGFALNPQATPYTKPLAILIDEGSASTSEILAGGLQDVGRARIFGTRSAGMALPSLIDQLPNGDTFQYAVANYISAGGQTLEGHGVIPDEAVEYKPPYSAPDPVIAAAVKWIKTQKEQSK